MRYLTREQISHIVNCVGQPAASLLIMNFFNGYRHTLTSADVAALYDELYINALDAHELYLEEKGKFRLNIYHKSTFEYILKKISAETRILDIGCGNGDLAIALASRNVKEVVGIDFSQRSIDHRKPKNSVFQLTLQVYLRRRRRPLRRLSKSKQIPVHFTRRCVRTPCRFRARAVAQKSSSIASSKRRTVNSHAQRTGRVQRHRYKFSANAFQSVSAMCKRVARNGAQH